MNKRSRKFPNILGIGLLIIAVLVFFVLVQNMPSRIQTRQAEQPVAQSIDAIQPDSPLPTLFTPVVVEMPTWTPFPTVPPPSTPTIVPGPSATALSSPKPAEDASGSIVFPLIEDEVKAGIPINFSLYSINVDSKGQPQADKKQLGNNINASGFVETASAPNGKRILISDGWGINSLLDVETNTARSPFADKSNPMGLFLGWHPDSLQILIRSEVNYGDIGLWLLDTNTGNHVTLLSPYPSVNIIQGGAVSPNGQLVAYAIQRDISMPTELWITDAKGNEHRKIYTSDAQSVAFSWSPDGNTIAFLSDGLMVIDIDGNNLRTVGKHTSIGFGFRIAWSPDSRQLAYTSGGQFIKSVTGVEMDTFANSNIYLVEIASSEERMLLTDDFTGIDPTWSPDGSQLAFVSKHSGTSEIWLINVDGSNLRQITNEKLWTRYPTWQR